MNNLDANGFYIEFINSEAFHNLRKMVDSLNSISLGVIEQIRPLSEELNSLKTSLKDFSNILKPMRETAKRIGKLIAK